MLYEVITNLRWRKRASEERPSSLGSRRPDYTICVITSYSIHYTKLYDLTLALFLRGSKVAALIASVMVSNPLTFFPQYYFSWQIGNWLLVITSYSIHYTKLYEKKVRGLLTMTDAISAATLLPRKNRARVRTMTV